MIQFYPDVQISSDELLELLHWVESKSASSIFSDANMGGNRKTTRYTRSDALMFPKVAFDIKNRISSALGFEEGKQPGFSDGMVASIAFENDTCYSHKDPVWHQGLVTVHCNLLLQKPSGGGALFIEGEECAMDVGAPICYPVSEVMHGTSKIIGETPRVMWIFGFCVPQSIFESAKEKSNVSSSC